jgi:hypothetical protein
MNGAAQVILLTGRPDTSKSTALRHVVAALGRLHPAPLGDRVKAHPRVTVRAIAAGNQGDLPGQVLSELARRGLHHPQPGQDDRA